MTRETANVCRILGACGEREPVRLTRRRAATVVSEYPWLHRSREGADVTTAERVRVEVRHPLEPLTAEEIEAASQILKQDRGLAASARFVYITLREPSKDAVLRYQRGEPLEREAHIVLRERAEHRTYEAVVSITAGEVRLWREVPGVQPAVMLEEFLATEEAVKKDA